MKNSALALAATLVVLGATASTAFAQSSVTVFGVVDANVRSIKNGSTTIKQLGNNGYSANQLGFRGVEDLGGGLRAGFHIESALSPDVGTATTENGSPKFWQRRATVSLAGGFGEVRLGRDLNASYLNLSLEAFGNLGVGSALNLVNTHASGVATLVRSDNMVAYYLPPTLGGLYGIVAVAAGENAPGNKYRGARLGYAKGPVNVAVGIGETQTATKNDFEIMNVAGAYDLGVVKLFGLANQTKFGVLKQTVMSVGAHVPIKDFLLRASVARANASGGVTNANDATLAAVGGVYFLSKRTQLYGTVSRIANKGTAQFSVSGASGIVPAAAARGKESSGIEFGLRHGF